MGCPTEVEIGTNLVFSVCTHDPDTGLLTDADAVPKYRIYEDESGQVYPAAAAEGEMAKHDDANTTGFYTELVACTAANGFEDGKSYTVYIEATVDSAKGGISYGFKAYTDVLNRAIPASPTADSINDWVRALKYALVNQMAITEATGNTTIYKDDDGTGWVTVAGAFATAAGVTTRKRLEP